MATVKVKAGVTLYRGADSITLTGAVLQDFDEKKTADKEVVLDAVGEELARAYSNFQHAFSINGLVNAVDAVTVATWEPGVEVTLDGHVFCIDDVSFKNANKGFRMVTMNVSRGTVNIVPAD